MSEALNVLQKTTAFYAAELRIAERQLQKAKGDDEKRALGVRIDGLKERRREIAAALVKLGAPDEP